MSNGRLRTYRFETKEQWGTCLFARADRDTKSTRETIRPSAPFASAPKRFESIGGRVPFRTHTGQVCWIDDHDVLHRISPFGNVAEETRPPLALICATRVVPTSAGLWTMSKEEATTLQLIETDSYTRVVTLDLSGRQLIDITSDGAGSFFALMNEHGRWGAISYGRAGRITRRVEFPSLSEPIAFTFLKASERFVIHTAGRHPKLQWFSVREWVDAAGSSINPSCSYKIGLAVKLTSVEIPGMRRCFEAGVLGSDSNNRVFLSGNEPAQFGGGRYIVTLDHDGNRIGDIKLEPRDGEIAGLAGCRGGLAATGDRGLLEYVATAAIPDDASEASRSVLVTPMLFSPDREDGRRWLRAEVLATLPEGNTLEISYASVDSDEDKDWLLKILNDDSTPESNRVDRILNETDLWKGRTTFEGSGSPDLEPRLFSAKLFDNPNRYLWVSVAISASPGAQLPSLNKLDVLYPGRTLMENLPSIYQEEEALPESFLRSLIGILEATTGGIDQRIATLGSLIDPTRTPEPWLDFIARWVGVPWDDSLSLEQKRTILARVPELAKARGTRTGLEALLSALLPGEPRRFRVIDATADFGFAFVGGGLCGGSRLPAMLGGTGPWNSQLDFTTVLGRTRLACPGRTNDDLSPLAGKVRIEVAATGSEREALEPWLLAMITEVIPLTARAELYWVTESSLRTNRLEGIVKLEAPATPHLDNDAITDLVRLPEGELRLSGADPIIGRRLL